MQLKAQVFQVTTERDDALERMLDIASQKEQKDVRSTAVIGAEAGVNGLEEDPSKASTGDEDGGMQGVGTGNDRKVKVRVSCASVTA